jgi:zinc D-Ala-D-Ala carboxypeptidase
LDNTPPDVLIPEGIALCEYELERVRLLTGCPIIVVSGYRSPAVNEKAGGSPSSQHMKFQAADIRTAKHTPQELFDLISGSAIRFDQLIQEFDSWVHISHSNQPRRQRFYAKHVAGTIVYTSTP